MPVFDATDSIIHDVRRYQVNIYRLGVAFVAVELLNLDYMALRHTLS